MQLVAAYLKLTAQQELLEKGQAILAANVDPDDGSILVNDATKGVMLGGALLGLTFDVPGSKNAAGGTSWNARDTYEVTFGPGSSSAGASS